MKVNYWVISNRIKTFYKRIGVLVKIIRFMTAEIPLIIFCNKERLGIKFKLSFSFIL